MQSGSLPLWPKLASRNRFIARNSGRQVVETCPTQTVRLPTGTGNHYAAYCGLSSNAERLLAIVAEIGVKKPLYRKELGKASGGDLPDSDCAAPHWNRQPARVTFLPKAVEKFTVSVSGHGTDVMSESSAED